MFSVRLNNSHLVKQPAFSESCGFDLRVLFFTDLAFLVAGVY
jgi:hypothetical protein